MQYGFYSNYISTRARPLDCRGALMIQYFRALSFNLNSYLELEIPPHNSIDRFIHLRTLISYNFETKFE